MKKKNKIKKSESKKKLESTNKTKYNRDINCRQECEIDFH